MKLSDQQSYKEFKVSKNYKISMLFMPTLFLVMGLLLHFDKTITGNVNLIIIIISQTATMISGFLAYSNFRFRVTFYEDTLNCKIAFKKVKEFRYINISKIKLFSLNGLKIYFNKKHCFISDNIRDSHELLKLLYEKVHKYNPKIIDEKLKRNFEKKYRYMLWRNYYFYWFKKNYFLFLFASVFFGVINVFIWNNYFRDVYLDLFFPFILPLYWFLLSYFVYSLKLRKLIKAISIEDSIDGLYNDFYNKSSYKKYFIIFTLILIVFCILSYVYLLQPKC